MDTTFDPGTGANDVVRALALLPDDRILIGGFFTRFNGVDQWRIARLFPNGSLDPTFLGGTNGANGNVYFIALSSGGHVLVSGAFTSINGTPLGKVARLEMDGTPDPDFHFALGVGGSYVYTVTEQAYGHLVIGGYFESVHGVPVHNLARLLPNGALDPSFARAPAPGSSQGVLASTLLPDGDVLIGGAFIAFGGRHYLAKMVANSGPVLEINPLGDDQYRVSWLTNEAEQLVLQSRPDLMEGSWQDTALPPLQTGHHYSLTVRATNQTRFLRLASPANP